MQEPECRTNTCYYVDFIDFRLPNKATDLALVRQYYFKANLSAGKIALEMGRSKTWVIKQLHKLGIQKEKPTDSNTNPKNYRHGQTPYGYAVKNRKLVIYKPELKVCRLIVELLGRKKWSASRVARELEARKFKNRHGRIRWSHVIVLKIFRHWNGKI